ncbi:MAG: ribonuclease R [Flavobacteriales bacterium]|nr:ribonuclease R [Flavobacteriales bacterium]MEB2342112.1 ribonuclease R [Flavobacteriia bacterium]
MTKKKRLGHPGELSRTVLLSLVREAGPTGITPQQLMLKLGLDKRERGTLQAALGRLVAQGSVMAARRGRYVAPLPLAEAAPKDKKGVEAVLDLIASGAGYARIGNGEEDVYIPEHALGTALHGDRVLIRFHRERGRPEGKVLQVLERRRTRFVGTVEKHGTGMVLRADDPKMAHPILIAAACLNGAKAGEKAVVEMDPWLDAKAPVRGSVVRVLGPAGDHEVEMHAILAEFDLPSEFSRAVEEAAEAIPDGATPPELARRRDMRGVTTFTIDPEDAKDLDDALSIRRLGNGHWEVGIHIADVSHYVQPGTVLDKEAAARATSVYLVDRVVPMLPERLSNNLCSLNPHTDKLSFSAIMELDDHARLHGEWFGRTVIRSDHRFSYGAAQAIIEGGDGPFREEVLALNRLAEQMRKDRLANGALDIGGNEVKFILDSKGKPIGVYEKMMGPANWLIEEFMLLANKRVATRVGKPQRGLPKPFVYRVHDLPDPEKVDQLRTLAQSFGHRLDTSDLRKLPHAINRLLHDIRGREEEGLIKQVTIRSMAKAVYSTDNVGHYGLAFDFYTHFTSPIRRYPDLMVHRALAHYLAGGKALNKQALELSCVHSSQMEKRAADAERASVRYKQAEYMLARLGQSFRGIVSGLTSWGMYVELIENKCEGMIALRDLPGDHYRFDQERYRLTGLRTGRQFRLGDELEVMVRGVDMEKRTVEFSLVEGEPAQAPPPRPGRGYWDETRPAPAHGGAGWQKGNRSAKGTGFKKARKAERTAKKGKKRR